MAVEDQAARDRLSNAMQARHHELDLSWDTVARLAGLSIAHLRRVRTGDVPLTAKSKWKIERALRWQRGSIDKILDGEEPEALPEPAWSAQGGHDASVDIPADVALDQLEPWEAHLWQTPQLSAGDRRTMIELVRHLRSS
jgi:hypothetical protein